ncbi:MAG TPA: SirB2 family protein [Xanthomonadales bacterium]|nr:SirB2 family protein [Xanthomonadales bacterium]
MNYVLLKQLHLSLALLSISGFAVRWWWRARNSSLSNHPAIRIAPHVLDTVFLITGIILAALSGFYPWSDAWLAAKIGGLLAYIILGMLAMSFTSKPARNLAFALALLTFAWVISVAYTKSAAGFFQVFT